MLMTNTGAMRCHYCGRPMAVYVKVSGGLYHPECAHGPGWQAPPDFAPIGPNHGAYTVPPLTEKRVREIVREEIAAAHVAIEPRR